MTPAATATARLVSLDAFRGAIMALMVLVNTAGTGEHVYSELRHASWHGWTLADVVFPSFVWIVGVAITLSLGKRLKAGDSPGNLLVSILRRAAIIFALGLLVYAIPKFDGATFRVLGVLQRIAICYLIAAAIFLYTGVRGQIVATLACLGGYWALMMFAPVPGHGAGHLDVERNFSHYIDRIVLGAHNYEHTRTWDPEGVISTLPSIASALLGVLAGQILALAGAPLIDRAKKLALTGAVLIPVALVWNQWLPINKSIWTSSFAVFMAGLDFVLFALCLWAVDIKGMRSWTRPFVIMGMNAIAVYMSSELIDIALWNTRVASGQSTRVWLYETFFGSLPFAPVNNSLLYAVAYTLFNFAIAYGLYRRGWFLRV